MNKALGLGLGQTGKERARSQEDSGQRRGGGNRAGARAVRSMHRLKWYRSRGQRRARAVRSVQM